MIIEIFVIGIVIGFAFGCFSSQWMLTKKVAEMLDKFVKKPGDNK